MPQAKRPTSRRSSSSRSSSSSRRAPRVPAFKEPAALKRLTKSLDTAQGALADLRKDVGRDTGVATRDLHKQLRTTLTGSRRDIGKLVKSLQRDFDQAQAKLAKAGARSTTRARSTRSRSTTGRSTRSRSTGSGASRGRSKSA